MRAELVNPKSVTSHCNYVFNLKGSKTQWWTEHQREKRFDNKLSAEASLLDNALLPNLLLLSERFLFMT